MIYETIRKAMLASLGVQEKMKEFLDDLVKKGELNESEGAKLMKEWVDRAKMSGQDMGRMMSDTVNMSYDKLNIASKDDLDALTKKVQQLSVRLKKLEGEVAGTREEH